MNYYLIAILRQFSFSYVRKEGANFYSYYSSRQHAKTEGLTECQCGGGGRGLEGHDGATMCVLMNAIKSNVN